MALFHFPCGWTHQNTIYAPHLPCLKLQVKCSRCWLFSLVFCCFFFYMITFQASILFPRRHSQQLSWCSAESRFDCDLLIIDACRFNDQMMNQVHTVQSVRLLMEIIWSSATHEWWSTLTWTFLKTLNNEWRLWAAVNKITAKAGMVFFRSFFANILSSTWQHF